MLRLPDRDLGVVRDRRAGLDPCVPGDGDPAGEDEGLGPRTRFREPPLDEDVRARALARVVAAAGELSLVSRGWIRSPITGAEGNVELLAAFSRNPATLEE